MKKLRFRGTSNCLVRAFQQKEEAKVSGIRGVYVSGESSVG
jgi:hypothetical protein